MEFKIPILLFCVFLILLLSGYVGYKFLVNFINTHSIPKDDIVITNENLAWNLDNCKEGDSNQITNLTEKLTITVRGITTYRGRAVCHSTGIFEQEGKKYNLDFYTVIHEDDECMVISDIDSTSGPLEQCHGPWSN